MISKVSLS